MRNAARKLFNAGLCVMPARRAEKRPVPNWKRYQERLPTRMELEAWFANGHDALCILAGCVSGNVEMIDFDFQGELFDAWMERLPAELRDRLVVECSQSGGRHVVYRCEGPVCGSMKLAQRWVDDEDGGAGHVITLIETRGEGGIFLCAPTAGYELLQGDLAELPVITEQERDVLLMAAWELNEYEPVVDGPGFAPGGPSGDVSRSAGVGGGRRPGDDFNARGDVGAILAARGWVKVTGGANEKWRRPGKARGWSATFNGDVFYVFSSNAFPFEPNRGYSRFAVYALLEHGGDYDAAAAELGRLGYGDRKPRLMPKGAVELGGIMGQEQAGESEDDPGLLPEELLRVPGFISEVMDFTMATAPYPNHVMAFCGALALQAFLAGRKVRDAGDNRTNLYLLGLAHSAAGKEHPRKINTQVCHAVGLAGALGDKFASGEGLQDALFVSPAMLFQTDEIDGMLQSINRARDARHENVMGTLLTLYSAANSVFPMRRKAGQSKGDVIDQPGLVIFGTAIPNHYYEALSERMLTNGFFARMIILEAGKRGKGQEPRIVDLPPRVLMTARWWADFSPGQGNLDKWHPAPVVVEHTPAALELLSEVRKLADSEYERAEECDDPVGTTVWGRVGEHIRKLALIYAVSENHEKPRIEEPAVEWATAFVMHQTRRMLYMAGRYVADDQFQALAMKLLEKLEHAPNRQLTHSVLLKRMKCSAETFGKLIDTLAQREDIQVFEETTEGRPVRFYRMSGL